MAKTEGQKQSRKHEDRLAKTLGGSRNAASGALWLRKGDVRNNLYLFEHKWTGKKQITIKSQWLEDTLTEALLSGRVGVLAFHLNGHDYVLLDESDFLDISRRAYPDEDMHSLSSGTSSDARELYPPEEGA